MSDMVLRHLNLQLHLLGTPHVTGGGKRTEVRPARPALLLAYLAWHGDWVTRDSLACLFHPEGDESRARTHLRLLLNRARKYDWASTLEAERHRVRFSVATDLAGAAAQLTALKIPPVFMQGWNAEGELGQWLADQRSHWDSVWRHSLLAAALSEQKQGRHEAALALLDRLLSDDSLAEDALQAYLLSAAHTPARQEALRRYSQFESRLHSELALAPLAQTRQLADALKSGAATRTVDKIRTPTAGGSDAEVPLTGRAAALAIGTATGPGSILLISGEAGIGKTRLVREILSGQDALWLQGRQGLSDIPWLPLTTALRSMGTGRLLELLGSEPLRSYRAELSSLLPELKQGSAAGASHSNPHRVLEAVTNLLQLLYPAGRTIVFDDAQWLDAETIRLLHYLHEQAQFRMFVTVRTGLVPDSWRTAQRVLLDGRHTRLLRLEALNQSEVSELLQHAAGTAPPAETVERLSVASGGNPLMLLQALADWRGRGWLGAAAGDTDWLELTEDTLTPLDGLKSLLLARVDALSEDLRRVLDAAAVLDHDLDARIVAGMTALSEAAAIRILGVLEDLGLLRNDAFAHGYIREVVLSELPESVRRHLHARAARLLQENGAEALVIAGHLQEAAQVAAAVELWLEIASTRYAIQPGFESETENLYRRIYTTDIRTAAWYQGVAYLGGRLLQKNERTEAQRLFDLVTSGSTDATARTFALLQTAFLHYLDGKLTEAELAAERAGRLVANLESPQLHSDMQLLNCMLLATRQKYAESLSISSAMVTTLRQKPPSFALGSWLARMAIDLCMLGRFEEALPVHHEQLEIARLTRHGRQQAAAINDTLATLDDLGRIGEGLELGLEGLKVGQFDVTWPLLLHVALARRARGDDAGALADTRRLLAGDPSLTTRVYGLKLLAELLAPTGDAAAVNAAVAEALKLTEGTELLEPLVIAAIAAVQYGEPVQATAGRGVLAGLDLQQIPASLRQGVQAALGQLQR